jgi:hypothetical protein
VFSLDVEILYLHGRQLARLLGRSALLSLGGLLGRLVLFILVAFAFLAIGVGIILRYDLVAPPQFCKAIWPTQLLDKLVV